MSATTVTSITCILYMRAPGMDQRFLSTWAAKYMKTELTYAHDVKVPQDKQRKVKRRSSDVRHVPGNGAHLERRAALVCASPSALGNESIPAILILLKG